MVKKRTPKPAKGVEKMIAKDPNSLNSRKVQSAIIELDKIVSDMEARWGIDRLPELIDEQLRERFERQLDRLNKAIDMDVGSEVKTEAEAMARAYRHIEKVAIANGHKELTGEFWQAPMPDGRVVAITQSFEEQYKVSKQYPDMLVYSVQEVANILANWKDHEVAVMTKHLFPGAEVTAVRPKEMIDDQELPF